MKCDSHSRSVSVGGSNGAGVGSGGGASLYAQTGCRAVLSVLLPQIMRESVMVCCVTASDHTLTGRRPAQCVSDPVCLFDNDSLMSATVSTLKRQASEPSLCTCVSVCTKHVSVILLRPKSHLY